MSPLVSAESAVSLVVIFIEQEEQVEYAVMGKRHAITDKKMAFWFVVLHVLGDGLTFLWRGEKGRLHLVLRSLNRGVI